MVTLHMVPESGRHGLPILTWKTEVVVHLGGVSDLPAQLLRHQEGVQSFPHGIDRRGHPGRPRANDCHIVSMTLLGPDHLAFPLCLAEHLLDLMVLFRVHRLEDLEVEWTSFHGSLQVQTLVYDGVGDTLDIIALGQGSWNWEASTISPFIFSFRKAN